MQVVLQNVPTSVLKNTKTISQIDVVLKKIQLGIFQVHNKIGQLENSF